jgi:2-amino-4-hydroxy-6-hydroxymethyldihydropteridine diphosphokinase
MRDSPEISPSSKASYVIGLGANLGDRLSTLRSAVRHLAEVGTVVRLSKLYESPALGPPQPDYLNAAVLLETAELSPEVLLLRLLEIERAHGRERRERWGPRTLDLDLLHGSGLVIETPSLRVPHPHLTMRAFALVPLLDVAPEAVDPRSGTAYAELASRLDLSNLRRLETLAPPWAE